MTIFFNGLKCCFLLLTLLTGLIVKAQPVILPDHESYQDFLIAPWKPGAPTLVVFKDPYCPYCVKALKQLDRLEHYNVFMFWSPILGKASVAKVNQILACSSPNKPEVFEAVINRSAVACDKSNNERLHELNQHVVESYNPNSVPSYYFGGKKVYVSSLDNIRAKNSLDVTPTKLNWQRYKALKVGELAHNGLSNVIVFTPSTHASALKETIKNETLYSWYFVDQFCLPGQGCSLLEKKSQELRLLLGQEDVTKPTVFVDGRKIEVHDYASYFSPTLVEKLSINPPPP